MFTRSFQIFSFLNVFLLLHILNFEAEAVKNERRYDIEELIRKTVNRYKNSTRLKDLNIVPGIKSGNCSVHNNRENQPLALSLKSSSKCLDDIKYTCQNKASQWALKCKFFPEHYCSTPPKEKDIVVSSDALLD